MSKNIVTDITGLYATEVFAEVTPKSTQDVIDAVKRTSGDISVGGGRFSMGGQIASPGSLHLDMRSLSQIEWIDAEEGIISVQSGATWHKVQEAIDPLGLAVSIMQTYGNPTVGGALSVNAHGRYVGQGPVILSVLEIDLVTGDGTLITATPDHNADIFYAAIGGYGLIGIITRATLKLAKNDNVQRKTEVMSLQNYVQYFVENVRNNKNAVFHNGDLYPPQYRNVRAVTWSKTDKPVNHQGAFKPMSEFTVNKAALWALSEIPGAKHFRERHVAPLLYKKPLVHARNYEASYRIEELEPVSRVQKTYVLQEYFVPLHRATEFAEKMADVLNAYDVNAINVSIRHAHQDPGSLMAWAKTEVFAFVLYYKQGTTPADQHKVAVWTRKLIRTALEHEGRYYLPYQPHATREDFAQAYPGFTDLVRVKQKTDTNNRFKNALWNIYSKAGKTENLSANTHLSDFHFVLGNQHLKDKLYNFCEFVFKTQHPGKFAQLIEKEVEKCNPEETEANLYMHLSQVLPSIKSPLDSFIYGLPALTRQKSELASQTLSLLGEQRNFDGGYLEIGSKGRYYSHLKKELNIKGDVHFVEERPVGYSPVDILERGSLKIEGQQHQLGDYFPINVAENSIAIALCYIGLHHAHADELDGFVDSIYKSLKPGGILILREHDAHDHEMERFVSLVHTVFNLGLGESVGYNTSELRNFGPLTSWIDLLERKGLSWSGEAIYQKNDPTLNALILFRKAGS